MGWRGGVCFWGVGSAKVGEHPGIELVGLGENPARTGEVADLARVDDAEQDVFGMKMGNQLVLVATGSLADNVDYAAREGTEAGIELGKSGWIIGDGESLVEEAAVDGSLGDICTKVDTGEGHGVRRWGLGLALPCKYELGRGLS